MVIYTQRNGSEEKGMDEFSSVSCEMVRLIETASAPIFGVDLAGFINAWSAKIAELTGLQANEAMGKSLFNEVVLEDSRGVAENLISRGLQGEEEKSVELKLRKFGLNEQNSVLYIVGNACVSRDCTKRVMGVYFVGQDITSEKAIIQSLNLLIPPIFGSDENAACSEWNAALEKLTGWTRQEIIGRMLPGEIFGGLCRLKGQNTLTKFNILLHQVINGNDFEKLPFGFLDRNGKYVEVLLTVNKRTDEAENIIGCFCFLQTIVSGVQAFGNEKENEERVSKLKELVFI
ncbi:hypothetical protein ACSBR2_014385 [Camellia fascicularis]